MKNEMKKNNEKKRTSPLIIVGLLVLASIAISIQIYNVLTVNTIVIKNDDLKKKLAKLKESNEVLYNEIEKLSTYQRIYPLAKELGFEPNRADEIKKINTN